MPEWRHGDADWTRSQIAQGHRRTHDPRWCVRTAVDLKIEADADVFLQAQRDAQNYQVSDSVFLEVKSG